MLEIKLDKIKINADWLEFLEEEFKKPYFLDIKRQYIETLKAGKNIYPPANLTFNAFNLTPLNSLKIVLLGQDPYHKQNQAMGLSFSVPKGVPIPPSLRNIFKELNADLGVKIPQNGDLSAWARQGVLLLNAIFSVEENKPLSHSLWGWQEFSDNIIKKLSLEKEGLIFILWGKFAQSKKSLIDTRKHFILEAAHPSPLARQGFLGCRHFSKSNALLEKLGKEPIKWDL
ncbi:uracil-DNA glycosylase [Campylobacter upsaliensis]|uniref:Uracil-DNA glycosylase n=1 Tax=Campylobacter upsaliensis JV21 TaxID=888826 RepID=A0A828QXP6_CAMUP|nr:uracil-DNA glycosylase [Campylobacter upsaliensis]EAB5282258.1 uracil-DNA glycosylase [Campylobacter upsaliensis]EAH4719802.1 uracil-DNA glycosylase [Campylobacter upsaliensis]EAH5200598.1 uracil-DNA glycosylase [Campylobacter upsaliensis]EAH5675952.1 uracil-DNA glycosylase [Campylobacter upsaliensis]EAH5880055.1 uracil-DNA glycosylase [Campylobacter upsaliensis]